MQVENRLSGGRTDVVDGTVASFDTALARNFRGNDLAIADDFRVLRLSFLQAADVPLGNDKDVRWSLGVYIFEGIDLVVLVNLFRANRTGDDFAEQAIVHERDIKAFS